jgi:hypothetical protein
MGFLLFGRATKLFAYPEDSDIRDRIKWLSLIFVLTTAYEISNLFVRVPVQLNIYFRPIYILVYR